MLGLSWLDFFFFVWPLLFSLELELELLSLSSSELSSVSNDSSIAGFNNVSYFGEVVPGTLLGLVATRGLSSPYIGSECSSDISQ